MVVSFLQICSGSSVMCLKVLQIVGGLVLQDSTREMLKGSPFMEYYVEKLVLLNTWYDVQSQK